MSYFCSSKLLAINCILLIVITCLVTVSSFLPYWFTLTLKPEDMRYGTNDAPPSRTISSGLFFMSTEGYVDMIFMSKISNHRFAPNSIIAGQLLYFMGSVGVGICSLAALILSCRKLGSVVGQFFLASFITISGISLVLGAILAAFIFLGLEGDNTWRNLPISGPNRLGSVIVPESVDIDWAFFIAIVAAVLAIVATVLGWLEALKVCRYVEDIRSKQLHDPNYGRKEEVAYTQFNYQQSYPDSYAVTVPAERPPEQMFYGEPGPQISQTVEI